MICRDGSVGAAGQIAPTKGYESLLKMVSVVVPCCVIEIIDREEGSNIMILFLYYWRFGMHIL